MRKELGKEPRIGILSPSYGIWGGGQIYIEKMCNYISSRRRCCVFTAEPEKFSCETRSIPVVVTPLRRLLSAGAVIASMRREGISHVVLNDLASAWLAPLFRACGFRVVALLHIPLLVTKGGHGKLSRGVIASALRGGAHKVLSVNPDNMTIAPGKSVFVGNFVSERFFGGVERGKSHDLCFVGRFSWEKNLELLLDIVAKARHERHRDLRLLLVGAGPDRDRLARLANELGIADLLEFSGWVEPERLPELYRTARCFAVTSHHEGFATTLLESHACGLPALTTRVGYCAEFVEGHGAATGFVFSREETLESSFYTRLFRLIDRHESYRESCIAKASLFSEERILDRIYREICT